MIIRIQTDNGEKTIAVSSSDVDPQDVLEAHGYGRDSEFTTS